MRQIGFALAVITLMLIPSLGSAVETAPRITDREIIERLTRLEEGQTTLRTEVQQLREDMNTQFDRATNIMMTIMAAFAGIVAVTIGFALWDRRTMIRPFETKVREIEEELSQNRQRLHSLLEALRVLSQTNEQVAEVLRRFHLL